MEVNGKPLTHFERPQKYAYMDDFIQKLQTEVVEQQKLIEILREENKILSSRILDLSENIDIPNRKPPHY